MILHATYNCELAAVVPVLKDAQELLTFDGGQSINPVDLKHNQLCLSLTLVFAGDTPPQTFK